MILVLHLVTAESWYCVLQAAIHRATLMTDALFGLMKNDFGWLCRANSPEERLKESAQNNDALTACIQQKHFAKSLQSSQLTQPAQLYCGIAETGYVHFMFVYKDPMRDAGFDDDISLSYQLPVRDA